MYVVTFSQWNNFFCLVLVEASCHHHDIHIYLLSDHLLLMANEILTNYLTFSWFLMFQGFEIKLAGRKYFFFSKYDASSKTSVCTSTDGGW